MTLWPVPDTGQTQSYTNTFGEDHDYTINQPSYTKLAAGCTPLPSNAAAWAMVHDGVTGLIWEEKHAKDGVANYADPNDADHSYTWYDGSTGTPGNGTDTLDFINALNAANYGGCGRAKMREMTQSAVDSVTRLYFALDPNQSVVPQSWIDADPKFWTPKPLPPAAPVAKKPGQ